MATLFLVVCRPSSEQWVCAWRSSLSKRRAHVHRRRLRRVAKLLVNPHGIKVPFPSQLATKLPYLFLSLKPQYRAKSKFHDFTFSLQTSQPERFVHQLVIDHNIGSHDGYHPDHIYMLVLLDEVTAYAAPSTAQCGHDTPYTY